MEPDAILCLVLSGFNDLETLFPDIAAEWSDRNLPLLPSMVTAFANRRFGGSAASGHEWNTLISTRSMGANACASGILLLKGFNDFATKQPHLAEEWSDRNYRLRRMQSMRSSGKCLVAL